MKKKYLKHLGILLLCSTLTHAAPVRNKKVQPNSNTNSTANNNQRSSYQKTDYSPRAIWNEKKFYIFGGLDLGYGAYSKSSLSLDSSRSGINFGVRALAAYYIKKFVFDGGLGWQSVNSSGTNTVGTQLKVSTQTLYLDLSPRYRLNQNWQIGPEAEFWFVSDKGLSSDISFFQVTNPIWIGAQAMYEWMKTDTKYRFGARWVTATNAVDRSANLFQIFFQIGFSPFGGKSETATEERPRYTEELRESDLEQAEPEPYATPYPTPLPVVEEPEPVVMSTPEPVPTATPIPVVKEKLVVSLDVNDLPFEIDSAKLPKYNRDRLQEIGRFLGENKNAWSSITVSGHTDERGKVAYNMKLSKARADTVRQLLGEGGAPINRIKSVGHGPNKPLDRRHNETAWTKNRRVELEFSGVKDGILIQKAFVQ